MFGALLLVSATAAAQSPSPDIRGIYVDSNAFPISKAATTALTASLTVPGVDGLVLVVGWSGIEPSMGQYQWDTVDQWMGMAISAGLKVELSVRADLAPAWLFQPPPGGAGAIPLTFTYAPQAGAKDCSTETIAAPWDPAFLAQWDAMLAAVAAHLKSTGTYSAVRLLRLTGINRYSDELHLPAQTPQSVSSPCVSDSVATWLQAGYRPSLLLQGWDGTTNSFKKSFPDKYFSVAIIDSSNPFPPIADDGSVIPLTNPQSLSPSQNSPLLTLASQKFPGHLIIQNNSLYPGVPAEAETIQFGQSLGTLTAFQTNEVLGPAGGAACGASQDTTPCTDATFLQELETGIYPLGKSNTLRAQYIEVFPANVNALPNATFQAHLELTCDYALNLSGQAFTSQGGTGTITITTGAGCPWTVGTLPAGVTLTGAGSGAGSGSVTFQVGANAGGDQLSSFTVAEQTFNVEQAAASIAGLAAAGSLGQVASEGGWDFSLIGVNLGT